VRRVHSRLLNLNHSSSSSSRIFFVLQQDYPLEVYSSSLSLSWDCRIQGKVSRVFCLHNRALHERRILLEPQKLMVSLLSRRTQNIHPRMSRYRCPYVQNLRPVHSATTFATSGYTTRSIRHSVHIPRTARPRKRSPPMTCIFVVLWVWPSNGA